ncbi:MAG: heavy-metal-associated domain-containing protein [Deltaproteobacteria bacterium]|nr:MAG: heavy-metal-associated domain-containing protein [Deltaproteobacteria bacterium]
MTGIRRPLSPLLLVGALALPGSLSTLACGSNGPAARHEGAGTATTATAPAKTRTATLAIEGMTCASCSVTVRTAARKLDGLVSIEVDVDGGRATVQYDPDRLTPEQIAEQISSTGYKTTVLRDPGA